MRVELTDAKAEQLGRVNAKMNSRIKGVSDKSQYGVAEYWEIADRAGDCEDYALAKLKDLRSLAWPKDALDIAVCKISSTGEYHAVLVVHTDKGDLVLDNLRDRVDLWSDLHDYQWIMVSVGGNLKDWHQTA